MSSGPDHGDRPDGGDVSVSAMGWRDRDGEPAASALGAVQSAVRGIRNPLVLIDGPSGAGKSTLADALVQRWPGRPPALVRLDDVYRGWRGLERAGAELSQTLVPPRLRSQVGRWRRWDWVNDRPGAHERLGPGGALIIEGCGAFAAGAAARSAVHVWVDAPDALRRRRALDRDGGAYDPYWDMWDRQWRRYSRRTAPAARADLRLRSAPDGRIEPGPDAGGVPVHAGSGGLT
jgi:hypothetical protein